MWNNITTYYWYVEIEKDPSYFLIETLVFMAEGISYDRTLLSPFAHGNQKINSSELGFIIYPSNITQVIKRFYSHLSDRGKKRKLKKNLSTPHKSQFTVIIIIKWM